ncbi:ABC transporter substrate-binding protein [Catellatospora sp. NPDC049609]|uniref:ABC transporter substrate-binding protein n=1 Tax=Catellatospora sp. NPDC049609 TaxID=3155505 RepID=UPI0034131185
MGTRRLRIGSVVAAILLATAACTDDGGGQTAPSAAPSLPAVSTEDKLVFGMGEPRVLDPALAADAESLRITRQVLETLVRPEPGGARTGPGLAERFGVDATGTVWTFRLKQGVTFHDGTPLDAAAVCVNFQRWYHFSGPLQAGDLSAYWQTIFGGFAKNRSSRLPASLFKSCAARDPGTVEITLTRPSSRFPAAFALPSFAISSPAALQKYAADRVVGGGYPAYGGNPVGTGPYRFVSWDRGAGLVKLEAFDGYHGGKAKVKQLHFQVVEAAVRRQALLDGKIDGYDLVAPADREELADLGYHVVPRPAFNTLYLGINQAGNPALAKPEVRQAIAYAVNRQRLLTEAFPAGAKLALNFHPDTLPGWNPDVAAYAHDPARAKELLAAAGYGSGLRLRFHYPQGVTRNYLPSPKQIFDLIAADLRAVGIEVAGSELPWTPEYLHAVTRGRDHDLHLFGAVGNYGEAYDFLGTLFAQRSDEFGFTDTALFDQLKQVESTGEPEARVPQYRQLNARLLELLPALPLVHGPDVLVFDKNLAGVVPSPLTDEDFAAAIFT